MFRKGKDKETAPRLLTARYLGGLAAVALLAVASTYLVWADITRQDTESAAIGLATDQIVASYEMEAALDRIAADAAVTERFSALATDVAATERFSALAAEARADYDRLLMGDERLRTSAERRQEVLTPLRSVDSALDTISAVAVGNDAGDITDVAGQVGLFRIGMEQVLTEYRASARERSETLQQRQIILLGSMLVLLVGEALFLFRPLSRRLHRDWREQAARFAATQDKVEYLTDFDRLTGLPNRGHVAARLHSAVSAARRHGGLVTLLVLNLDDFHAVNDQYGTDIGDRVIVKAGRRIRDTMGEEDTVGRLGGDDFAVVLEGSHKLEDVGAAAQRILDALEAPLQVNNKQLLITASIGIVVYPLDGDDVEGLFRDAGIALNTAKGTGRGTYVFFTQELRQRTSERHDLIDGLRGALKATDELRLVYQPKIDIRTGAVIGVEALLRWEHPDLGLILPGKFIPLAEETDLIIPLGEWVLNRAVAQASVWADREMPVSINLSSRQFRHGDLVESVAEALSTWDLEPQHLEVELTEGTLIEDVEGARATLRRLKEMGIKVSIDDFGTGYSSLSYLKRFPIDTLKIDRSFINDITEDPDDAAISRAIVSLARSLHMSVVAEGVETNEQLDFLKELGCDAVQGYLFSKPLPPESLERFVAESPSTAAAS